MIFKGNRWFGLSVLLCMNLLSAAQAERDEALTATTMSEEAEDPALVKIKEEQQAIDNARDWVTYRHRKIEIACYQNFFVTHCLDENTEQRRQEMRALRQREIRNNQVQRDYTAQKRADDKAHELISREYNREKEDVRRVENRENYEQKLKDAKDRQAQMNSLKRSAEREKNRRHFEQKQKEAAQRRQAFEKDQAEKQQRVPTVPAPFSFPDTKTGQ
ncbi:MAG: hypothetical protein IT497_00640 [Ottowia sp.]|nr:hypothetical protein [Ottowia sp.]